MTDISKLHTYLKTMAYEQDLNKPVDLQGGHNPFITISRETGAGGHSLAAALLKLMAKHGTKSLSGWHVLDQEICEKVAAEPGLKVSLHRLLSEEYHSQIEDMIVEMFAGDTPQDAVARRMFAMMRTLATFGKVILIGRAGAFVTQDLPLGIHVRLVAPVSVRIRRMAAVMKTDENQARRFIEAQDEARAKLVKVFFNGDIADPLYYHATFNTGRLSIENAAEAVLGQLHKKEPVLR